MFTFLQPDRLSAMRAGTFRTPRVRLVLQVVPVLLALLATLTPSASAQSLYRFAPATNWGYTYAAPATNFTTSAIPKSANLEKLSTINVNYNNFPDWAKKELQLAVDIWGASFQSKVAITIDATWSSSQSLAILGSARPGGYFAGFSGAPDSSLWYPSALAKEGVATKKPQRLEYLRSWVQKKQAPKYLLVHNRNILH